MITGKVEIRIERDWTPTRGKWSYWTVGTRERAAGGVAFDDVELSSQIGHERRRLENLGYKVTTTPNFR